MKIFFKLLILAVLFASCDEEKPTIYNGEEGNSSFISFSRTLYALPIERDGQGSATITINSSTVSSSDRTYNLELIPSESTLAADPATFTLPTSITIPAGSYQGVATITGTDNGLVDSDIRNFTFRINNFTNEDFDTNVVTVNVYEVCPLQAPFTGEYNVTSPSSQIFGEPVINQRVTLVQGETVYDRQFEVSPYRAAGFGLPRMTFIINFGCDFLRYGSSTYDTGLACTGGPTIKFRGAIDSVPYNTQDDSTFNVKIFENISSSCGGSPVETTITFTKVN